MEVEAAAALQLKVRVVKISRFGASHGFRRFNRG